MWRVEKDQHALFEQLKEGFLPTYMTLEHTLFYVSINEPVV